MNFYIISIIFGKGRDVIFRKQCVHLPTTYNYYSIYKFISYKL